MSTERSASIGALNRIHKKLAEAIDAELQNILDTKGDLPANLINAVSAFLKANDITADVAEQDELTDLRKKLAQASGSTLVEQASELEYLN